MLKVSTIIFISAFLFSCSSPGGQKNESSASDTSNKSRPDTSSQSNAGYLKINGDSLVIPSFEIELSLSPKANEKLRTRKESIIVAAYFSGQPKDTTSKEYMESGAMSLAEAKEELMGEDRTAKFENVKFPRSLYDSLADKDIQVLINIYSGRRSGPDNLLDCDILQEKMSAVKEKKFTLKGKLISEK